MEYIYGALLLHSTGSKVDEAKLKKVLEEAGATPDPARVKALVSSLKGLNIDEVLKNAASMATVAAPAAEAAPSQAKPKKKKEEKAEEEKEEKEEAGEQDAMAGLSSLFG